MPGPRDAQLSDRWPGTPEIYRLHVAPQYQSLGIGTMLIRHMEELAASKGHVRVGLGVHASNTRAHALYRRPGYEPDPIPFFGKYVLTLADGNTRSVSEVSTFLVKPVDSRTALVAQCLHRRHGP